MPKAPSNAEPARRLSHGLAPEAARERAEQFVASNVSRPGQKLDRFSRSREGESHALISTLLIGILVASVVLIALGIIAWNTHQDKLEMARQLARARASQEIAMRQKVSLEKLLNDTEVSLEEARKELSTARKQAVEAGISAESAMARYSRARQELTQPLFRRGVALAESMHSAAALAYFAAAVRIDGHTPSATRIVSLLAGRKWPEPGKELRHEGAITSACLSPDGRTMLLVVKGRVQMFQSASGELLHPPLEAAKDYITAVFKPNGTQFATGTDSGLLQQWDSETLAPVGSPVELEGPIVSIAYDPSGERIAAVASGGVLGYQEKAEVHVWNAKTMAPVVDPIVYASRVNSVAFHPAGDRILVAANDQSAQVWSLENGQPVEPVMLHGSVVNAALWSPDGSVIATATQAGQLTFWDAESAQLSGEIITLEQPIDSLSFSSDGQWIGAASGDAVWLWNSQTRQLIGEPMRNEDALSAFSMDENKRVLCAYGSGNRGSTRIWKMGEKTKNSPQWKMDSPIRSLAINPSGDRLALSLEDGSIHLRDARTGEETGAVFKMAQPARTITFSPDGHTLATLAEDGAVWLWSTKEPQAMPHILKRSPDQSVVHIAFTPDGSHLILSSQDQSVQFWNLSTNKAEHAWSHSAPILGSVASPDGKSILSWGELGILTLAQPSSSKEPFTLFSGATRRITSASFHPDGTLFAISCEDGTASLWNTASRERVSLNLRHEDAVTHATFSPDGKRILTTSRDGTATVWETATSAPLSSPTRHSAPLLSGTFSPQGGRIVTMSTDHLARVWDARSGEPLTDWIADTGQAVFSPDGMRLITTSLQGEVRIRLLGPEQPAPEWLAALAEAVGGHKLDDSYNRVALGTSSATIQSILSHLDRKDASTPWRPVGKWLADGHLNTRDSGQLEMLPQVESNY